MKKQRLVDLHPHEEVDVEGSWAVSYGDMVTLLLCFFILFFSVKPDAKDNKRMQSAVFNLLLNTSKLQNTENLNNGNSENKDRNVASDLSYGKENESGIPKEVLLRFNGVPHKVGEQILIEFPGVSFFDSGSIHLTQQGVEEILRFSKIFSPYISHFDVGVRAFTDSKPVRADKNLPYKNNLELSALRSVSTMRILAKSGVPVDNIKLGGFGELRLTAKQLDLIPIEKRKLTSEFDLARRVVLVIEQRKGAYE
jgi:chemotaxis protein MotB